VDQQVLKPVRLRRISQRTCRCTRVGGSTRPQDHKTPRKVEGWLLFTQFDVLWPRRRR